MDRRLVEQLRLLSNPPRLVGVPMPWLARKYWRSAFRRLIACVSLFAYAATALGLPVPLADSKDRGQPFPCQDHACGCRTAEQCWRGCCCFTPEEKLAWGRANHVVPPPYADPSANGGWQSPRLRDQCADTTPPAKTCACCKATAIESNPRPARACCADPSETTAPNRPAKKAGWALGIEVLRCRGLSTFWVTAGATPPPPPVVAWHPGWPLAGQLLESDLTPHIVHQVPPEPPPRHV
jgi:hypothetical protein